MKRPSSCSCFTPLKVVKMAYELTEEQRMIRAMVREFARAEILPAAAERDRTEISGKILAKMGELGLMGMNVPIGIRRGRGGYRQLFPCRCRRSPMPAPPPP